MDNDCALFDMGQVAQRKRTLIVKVDRPDLFIGRALCGWDHSRSAEELAKRELCTKRKSPRRQRLCQSSD
jgi:hypothetical protein